MFVASVCVTLNCCSLVGNCQSDVD